MPSLPNWSNGKSTQADAPKILVPAARASVDCAVYVDGVRLPGKYTHRAALAEVRSRDNAFVWVGMYATDGVQMQYVTVTFGLHELMVEDAVHVHECPKLERYDDVMFLVLRTGGRSSKPARSWCFGPDFVVTVRHGDHSELASVRKSLE